jgi:putative FmdB family regulatory protein
MPLYDFHCRTCGRRFETLVRTGTVPACPHCQGTDLDRQVSTFAVSSAERTQQSADKKRKREADSFSRDQHAMEREIEEHRKEDH